MDPEIYVWWSDRIVPESEITISPFEPAYLYGYSLFETMRPYDGGVHLLRRHLERLAAGAKTVGIDLPSHASLRHAVAATLAANDACEGRVRLTLFGEARGKPTVAVQWHPPMPGQADPFKPVSLHVSRVSRYPSELGVRPKSGNYLAEYRARIEAVESGADEALLLTPDGFVAEGSVSNVFCVRKGVLLTPPVEVGILPGITRGRVIEIARASGLDVVEGRFTLAEMIDSEECFITNSVREIVPVREVDGKEIGENRMALVTNALAERYRAEIVNEEL